MIKVKGFTLIELTMAIVIIAILAAIAMPKFIDLRQDAQRSALVGMAGSMASGSVINEAGCQMTNNVAVPNKCSKVSKCSDIVVTLNGAPVIAPAGVPVVGSYNFLIDTPALANDIPVNCTLQFGISAGVSVSRTFVIVGNGN